MRPAIVHLLQSTAFAVVAAGVAAVLRNDSANARYRVWFFASMKFLVPFAPLVALGSLVKWRPAAVVANAIPVRPMEQIGEIFRTPFVTPHARPETTVPIAEILACVWICGTLAVSAKWFLAWQRMRRMARAGRPMDIGTDVPVEVLVIDHLEKPSAN